MDSVQQTYGYEGCAAKNMEYIFERGEYNRFIIIEINSKNIYFRT